MTNFKHPVPAGKVAQNVNDGTLIRQKSFPPGPLRPRSLPGKAKSKFLALDGEKVHEFLSHVAEMELEWLDLTHDAKRAAVSRVPKEKVKQRVEALYQQFLEASSKGPNQATAFLAQQHELLKKYAEKSQAIYQSLSKEFERNEIFLAKVAFGLQLVKSGATVGVAILGLMITGPAVLAGAGVALLYDAGLEVVKRLGPSHESDADSMVIGFRQTMANDSVGVVGAANLAQIETRKALLENTLRYPLKSSTYRSLSKTGAGTDALLRKLGWIAAGVTVYSEGKDVYEAWERLEKTEKPENQH